MPERRAIAGWQVERGSERDGGRMVRMVRSGQGVRLEVHASFWHGHSGPMFRIAAERSGRGCGTDEWRSDWDSPAAASDMRSRLAGVLRACGASTGEIRRVLSGFDHAYVLAAEWSRRAEAATRAEIEAIAGYGSERFEVVLWAGEGADRSAGFVRSGNHACGAVATVGLTSLPPYEEGLDAPLGTELIAELGGAPGEGMRWSAPVDYRPIAISGERILIDHAGQWLWIDTSGNLERDAGRWSYPEIEATSCPPGGSLARSAYARCGVLIDLATGHHRQIQYEGPCT